MITVGGRIPTRGVFLFFDPGTSKQRQNNHHDHHYIIIIFIIHHTRMKLNLRYWCYATTAWSVTFVWLMAFPPQQHQPQLFVQAWYQCPPERGGGICPDAATCCATATPGISSCISEKEEEYVGVCCADDTDTDTGSIRHSSAGGDVVAAAGLTGCDHNYQCARAVTTNRIAATTITSTTEAALKTRQHSPPPPHHHHPSDNNDDNIHIETDDMLLLKHNNATTDDADTTDKFSSSHNESSSLPQLYCQRIEHPDDVHIPEQLPRYQLCTIPRPELTHLFGFAVQPNAPRLAYYSSLNALDATDAHTRARHAHVRLAWIFIHGSKRNADDYHCCALATLPRQEQDLETTTILVLSPRFLDRSDRPSVTSLVNEPTHCISSKKTKKKTKNNHNNHNNTSTTTTTASTHSSSKEDCSSEPLYFAKHGPIAHTWRYGADAVNAPISSYEAMDAMVEALAFDTDRFPNLEQIVVAGHSAGGQFVHRWALTSMSPAWGDAANPTNVTNVHATATARRIVPIHAVAANPRSFAYLDQRRFDVTNETTTFDVPDRSRIHNCPGYNQWEWGLEPGGPVIAQYKDRALQQVGGAQRMAARYAKRKVTYLAGGLDVLPLWSECEDDDFQGPNRRTRSELFYKSLLEIFGERQRHVVHQRVVVPMVHHDHCLLFQSKQGREVLFGPGGGESESQS